VRQKLSGRGGATGSHGHIDVFGCSFQPTPHGEGRAELRSPVGAVPTQDGDASGSFERATPRHSPCSDVEAGVGHTECQRFVGRARLCCVPTHDRGLSLPAEDPRTALDRAVRQPSSGTPSRPPGQRRHHSHRTTAGPDRHTIGRAWTTSRPRTDADTSRRLRTDIPDIYRFSTRAPYPSTPPSGRWP
jgi:hypothetical protein